MADGRGVSLPLLICLARVWSGRLETLRSSMHVGREVLCDNRGGDQGRQTRLRYPRRKRGYKTRRVRVLLFPNAPRTADPG